MDRSPFLPSTGRTAIPFRMNEDPSGSMKQRYPVNESFEQDIVRPATAASGKSALPARLNTAGTVASSGAGRPLTAMSVMSEYNVVVLIENRARDVGVAVVNLSSLHSIQLLQLHDNQSYTQTFALLQLLRPVEIVMSKSQSERVLFQKIVNTWGGEGRQTQIAAISRKFFDETLGAAVLHSLSATTILADLTPKYLAVASLAALVKYVENMQHITFAEKSIEMMLKEPEGRMAIDFETIKSLEVFSTSRTNSEKDALFGVLNRTQTAVGARFLRSQLLSPLSDSSTINTRLDCVEELIRNDKMYFDIRSVLGKVLDMDSLLSQLVAKPKITTQKTAKLALSVILGIKHMLKLAPHAATALATAENPLLLAIRKNVGHAVFDELNRLLDTVVMEDASLVKSTAATRHHECFAIRPHIDGNLDAIRKIYIDTLDDMNILADRLKDEWECPALRVNHTEARGYHLVVPSTLELPPTAIRVVAAKSTIACSTEEFETLNDRIKESLFNIYVMTNVLLQDILAQVRLKISALLKLNESLAILDLIVSFASIIVTSAGQQQFVRPILADESPTVIVQGRHPITERALGSFVPNDIFIGPGANLHLLTGRNGAGKSTFLKQLAMLTIMAHIGCFVPAEHATFRITHRICTRIGTSDDIEANASSFLKEMKEASFIIDCIKSEPTHNCLVLIDELGRGTSNEDGLGLAWAICESLLCSRAYTICVTHFHELVELGAIYPNVRISSMGMDDAAGGDFSFKLVEGNTPMTSDYGIKLAEMCGLPKRVIEDARRIREKILSRSRPRTALVKPQKDLHTRWDIDTTPTRQSSYEMLLEPTALRRGLTTSSDISEVLLYTARTKLMSDVASRLAPLLTIGDDPSRLNMARSQLQAIRDEYAPQLAALGLTEESIAQMLEESDGMEVETPRRMEPVVDEGARVAVDDSMLETEGVRLFDDDELDDILVSRGDLSCAQVQQVHMDAPAFAESVLTVDVPFVSEHEPSADIVEETTVAETRMPVTPVEPAAHDVAAAVAGIQAQITTSENIPFPPDPVVSSPNKCIDDLLFDAFF